MGTTISAAPERATLTGGEKIPASHSGTKVHITPAGIASYLVANNPTIEAKLDTLASIAALQAASYTTDTAPSVVFVLTNHEARDGGGFFSYDSSDTTSADDGGCIIVTASGRRYKRNFQGPVHISWYTPGGASTDARVPVQAWLDYCWTIKHKGFVPARGKVYKGSKASGGNWIWKSKGVSIEFEPAVIGHRSCFAPYDATVTSSVDILFVQPDDNNNLDFFTLDGVCIRPDYDGTKRGKRAIAIDTDETGLTTNMSKPRFKDLYLGPSNDYSLEWVNSAAENAQGVPFAAIIDGGYFAEGIKGFGHADSLILNNTPTIRSSSGSSRVGLDLTGVNGGGGVPTVIIINGANIDADGGAIAIHNSRRVVMRDITVEQSHGSCANVVSVTGDDASCEMPLIDGISVASFGTAAVSNALIYFGATTDPKLDNYHVDTAATGGGFTAPPYGIDFGSGSSRATLGEGWIRSGRFGTAQVRDQTSDGIKRATRGPLTTTDNRLPRFDGTEGLIQSSGITVDDSNNISGAGTIASGAITSTGAISGTNLTASGTLGVTGAATFSSTVTASSTITGPAGNSTTPGVRVGTNSLGLYEVASDQLGVNASLRGPNGSASKPTFECGDAGLGWYRASSGVMGLTAGSAAQWQFGQHLLSVNGGRMLPGNGSASLPGYGFANDATSGLYLIGASNVGMAIGAALSVDYNATRTKFSQPIEVPSYVVASLPTVGAARVAYASNGRKSGEGASSGTGVLVFGDASAWRAVDTGATVAA